MKSALLLVALMIAPLLGAFSSSAADTAKMEAEGKALVQDLLSRRPATTFTNTGVMKLRMPKSRRELLLEQRVALTSNEWQNIYTASTTNGQKICILTITHADQKPNQYQLELLEGSGWPQSAKTLTGDAIMMPFATTDFWLADLGLEFLHWPVQRLLRKELKDSQFCAVLESISPEPTGKGYVRVVSWIHLKNGGTVYAIAYDANNKKLKEFEPKAVEKVNDQYELKSMEIRNEQTDTRTTIVFNLGGK